jgi:hypothetical protein
MAISGTSYHTETVAGHALKFYNDPANHTDAWCDYAQLMGIIYPEGVNHRGQPGEIGNVPTDAVQVQTPSGWVTAIKVSTNAIAIVNFSVAIMPSMWTLKSLCLAALSAGQAALP